MKILHVITSVYKNGGGTSEVVPRICEELVAAGHEVRLVTGNAGEQAESAIRAAACGVDVRYPPLVSIPHLNFIRLTSEFKREIKEGIAWCDVVHIHGHWQDVPWFAARVAHRLSKPYFMQPHGFLEPERLKKSALQKKIVGALIERPNLNRAAAVIATAESEKIGIKRFGVRVPIEVVPLGLDTDEIDSARRDENLLSRLGLNPSKKTLLYFSRLTPIKGLDMLAEVWNRLNEFHSGWQLCITGPDDRGYTAQIKKLYDRIISDGSVCFTGPVYGDDKYALLKSVDAFVLPTRSENWSIAVQEALAAGLPTVCTKGAPWEVIEKHHAGYWVDVGVDPIYDGILKLLSASSDCFRQMSNAGQALVKSEFGWKSITQTLCKVYQSCKSIT